MPTIHKVPDMGRWWQDVPAPTRDERETQERVMVDGHKDYSATPLFGQVWFLLRRIYATLSIRHALRMLRPAAIAFVLVLAMAGCSSRDDRVELDVKLELGNSAKKDCRGPRGCRVSYLLTIQNDGREGFYQYRCDVKAFNDEGRVVFGTTLSPISREEMLGAGQAPYKDGGTLSIGRVLRPAGRRSITSLSGTCDAFLLQTGAVTY
ncbi:MAG: hypothetical protein ABI572_09210 [Actinomycetota bacterium]